MSTHRGCKEFVRDGFVTSGDPLCVNPIQDARAFPFKSPFEPPEPVPGAESMTPFVLGYVKGSARMCTLLVVCLLFLDDDLSLEKDAHGYGV